MKVVVTGSRDWFKDHVVYDRLKQLPEYSTIIQGGCPSGADARARELAESEGFDLITVHANWKKFGRSAGPRRNRKMLALGPDLVIAFCRNNSSGTMSCYNEAVKRGISAEMFREGDEVKEASG